MYAHILRLAHVITEGVYLTPGRPSLASRGNRISQCIHSMVLESQLPHKTVNLLLTITTRNNKLTILWGFWLSKTNR